MDAAEEHKKKGNDAFKNQDWDLAIKEYNKAISLDPKAAFYSNRAACWSYKGNHESALADATRCLEIDPAYVKGYSRKGKALFDLSRLDEAEEAYKAGLAVEPNNQGCTQGLADVKAGRAKPRSSSGLGSAFSSFSTSSWMQKLKQGGLGGRMQMYMVAFAGYYMYKNYMGKTSETVPPETEEPQPPQSISSEIQRGFEQVSGQWSSFLENRDGEHSLVFLHQTGSSAEGEFSRVLPLVQKAAATPLSLFAPDRPCHGYSPCGTGGAKWLQGLLKRRQTPHMAYVASGRQASQIVLDLLRQRKESAQVLLISPTKDVESPSDFQSWLREQSSRSPQALADAVRWASEPDKELQDVEGAEGAAEGCSITILTDDEDKVFLEELEEQGHVVRSRRLSTESLEEEVAKESAQLF